MWVRLTWLDLISLPLWILAERISKYPANHLRFAWISCAQDSQGIPSSCAAAFGCTCSCFATLVKKSRGSFEQDLEVWPFDIILSYWSILIHIDLYNYILIYVDLYWFTLISHCLIYIHSYWSCRFPDSLIYTQHVRPKQLLIGREATPVPRSSKIKLLWSRFSSFQ